MSKLGLVDVLLFIYNVGLVNPSARTELKSWAIFLQVELGGCMLNVNGKSGSGFAKG